MSKAKKLSPQQRVNVEQIKRLTITALLSDEELMGTLVLKGGNALDLAYQLSSRASIDVDFSMTGDFNYSEQKRLREQAEAILNLEFNQSGLQVFDVNLFDRPEHIAQEAKLFWGGYRMEFKVIETEKFNEYEGNLHMLRNLAIPIKGNSTIFPIDISKYEYTDGKTPKEIDGALVNVYSPAMLALEKVRAMCQQNIKYKKIIISMTARSRARDLYDIYNLVKAFGLDFSSSENKELCEHIFNAKHVPHEYISELEEHREFLRQSWPSVVATVNKNEKLEEFDYYFDFVMQHTQKLL